MKKVRLEIPLDRSGVQLRERVWIKVNNNQTEFYEDKDFTIPILNIGKKIFLEINIPDQLEAIEVMQSRGKHPATEISVDWHKKEVDPNWKIPKLKKITIIFNDRTYEVPVINERPDTKSWDYIRENSVHDTFPIKTWALVVYMLESKSVAAFHWNPRLTMKL